LTNCVAYEKLLFHERCAVSSGVVGVFLKPGAAIIMVAHDRNYELKRLTFVY